MVARNPDFQSKCAECCHLVIIHEVIKQYLEAVMHSVNGKTQGEANSVDLH